jgi:hypothetical protein
LGSAALLRAQLSSALVEAGVGALPSSPTKLH